MTRREEIEHAWFSKAVQSNHRYDEKSFKEAVEWADKTMIEKACEWIISNMPKYVKANRLDVFINNEDMANDFKQAMEE
jgi:hypothetical protein